MKYPRNSKVAPKVVPKKLPRKTTPPDKWAQKRKEDIKHDTNPMP